MAEKNNEIKETMDELMSGRHEAFFSVVRRKREMRKTKKNMLMISQLNSMFHLGSRETIVSCKSFKLCTLHR